MYVIIYYLLSFNSFVIFFDLRTKQERKHNGSNLEYETEYAGGGQADPTTCANAHKACLFIACGDENEICYQKYEEINEQHNANEDKIAAFICLCEERYAH